MEKAKIIFKENTPFSLDFDDFYFSHKNALEERRFVYSEAFELKNNPTFIIAELGFGIGLNFFLSLKRFLRDKKGEQRLFYVSLENFYIPKDELRMIYQKLGLYEEFKELLEPFLKLYPKQKNGSYRFYFKDVFLDLVFNEAAISLKELDFKADVWYLDGFSPAKNQSAFDENIIKEIARLSKLNAQLCTFSASSFLQNSLKKYNFKVQKCKGYCKREMIKAYFMGFDFEDKEAYFQSISQKAKNNKIAIIGAGIAGASLAYELSLRGFKISVFEKNESIASEASGNESGVLSSLILKPKVALGEFSELCFYEASRFYQQILKLEPNGVYEFAYNELMQERFNLQKENPLFDIKANQAFLDQGLDLSPKDIVNKLFIKSKAELFLGHEFTHFTYENEGFKLHFKEQSPLKGYGILIYALGSESKDFIQYEAMNLSKVRGQVSLYKPFLRTKHALSSKGYVCVPKENLQLIGASYDRQNTSKEPLQSDDALNLSNIKEFLPQNLKPEFIGSRVAFRSYSSDRFAIFGAMYDEVYYKKAYKSLLWSKTKGQPKPKYIDNLYLSIAHGSRGFASAIIAARYISALICDEPLFLNKSQIAHIHPARFLIRKLKKGL
ncbi:bifunctional tRNA (5-methylaminomethyl-2-thiouridine)(34)-methyltransferase MnmD/FAD-dependent 5-carboxymethylaminomethyl-2-thiouridine(34) oxidoreductase MnmC [Campylobacter sp. MIT 12-5580]|uniref:bifunctional tRNA (5-methylaminomethyl-2-thiouridine)(34)-methyltransferase MnmD/FAD-dependent 5-carboxymethylaminomethyl-2-thiouridine(34) oxidoreductase MnmC n=1 Tax=Campylobacter sp. MIT 12-5580 TaxID=2040651 RepID=UPI0010F6B95E|nr:bifunctional tRNA (5-methylaminomethyl-2-thiouridine)(34)-methyltransferase MnmD/FAD-dependent 5-carboxymethylaminomethyl-2-thiouridine(34) oxidoreductase MnmC [Campylobacter sp. MIT 12-5580]TKX30348.1 bifunctional tRNA (5-methylaminomethyl-2-thiouridine)(34)-methyltransferase MnmD/FAD-dependent 5-carboxymethylaminomethyl-2-thiouridine(34) oxidoreductase MnmC [Campylobacter sp. MIT 12-5580]